MDISSGDESFNSNQSAATTIAVLKEQIDFLHARVVEKQSEVDEKNRVIDQLHAEKRLF